MKRYSAQPATSGKVARSSCPACGGNALEPVYSVKKIPVHSCVLLHSREEAIRFPRRDLQLDFCRKCGLLFNSRFDPEAIAYSDNFEESQHFSDTFNEFAKQLAREIADDCQTAGRNVVEIGCGKGEFLLQLCAVGDCTGVGIDPGFRPDRIRLEENGRVNFLADCFGPKHEDLCADIILCRHTLEHIPEAAQFIQSIYRLASKQTNPTVVFETPDVKRVLQEGAFWDIYYEHCSYFSPGAHARLFRRCGFEVTKLELVYQNQYIVQYARPESPSSSAQPLALEDDLDELGELVSDFPHRVQELQSGWKQLLADRRQQGQRTALWGGGSKGIAFLTTLGLQDEIDAVVDVNPYKQGKFLPGTGHQVVAPERLRERPPSLVIVMNEIYLDEIRRQLKQIGLTADVIDVGGGTAIQQQPATALSR